ncbi:MAG: polynucleotide adenylyltransferase [Arcobacteraceae bacterium]|nr:polynucleotide adenylyltransferase [Arcobacteraceae bacterium]
MITKKIYQVGGCVRDKLLGIKSSDIDFVAVGYIADDFKHLSLVGKDFPVFLDEDGCEIALARVDRKVGDGYNGFEVDTVDVTIQEDLKRRDLTINSIAYDEITDSYIDPYGGMEDIENKILRHTSSAFKEDPLRVLRLARFQAKFPQFKIASQTKEFVKQMKSELKSLQPDRVYKEIQKVFKLEKSELFFETLLELEILDILFPNIYNLTTCSENSVYHKEKNVFIHTMMVLKELKDQSQLLKTTAIFHDIAKPLMYKKTDGANAGGHDNPKSVEPLIDMQLPIKLQKKMLFIIKKHLKIYNLDKMNSKTIATFFENYRKDRELFVSQLIFAKADTNGRIGESKKELDEAPLLDIFDKIARYSPKTWIDSRKNSPNGETIKQHIHRVNIKIVNDSLLDRKE